MQAFEVGNDKVALRFAVNRAQHDPLNPFPWKGIRLESIHDLDAGREFLESPTDLFEYALNDGSARSSRDLDVTGAVVTDGGRTVRFEARDSTQHLLFDIDVRTDGDRPAVVVRLTISVLGDDPALRPSAFLRMVYPKLQAINWFDGRADRPRLYGMVPMEIGAARPLGELRGAPWRDDNGPVNPGMLGKLYDFEAAQIGLPISMNTMELASIYASAGGGLFVADIDHDIETGTPPVQLTVSAQGIAGFWIAELRPGTPVTTPQIAMGVHPDGDWHTAVDYYVGKHRPRWQFQRPPSWFVDQAAIYAHTGGGAGGMYMSNSSEGGLAARLRGSFKNLPLLLSEARSLGTNIVYLFDYWEMATTRADAHAPDLKNDTYANKGDYRPRTDLGGESDLKLGIRAVHEAGGKVIMYVEPFIVFVDSDFARAQADTPGDGEQGPYLAGRYPTDPPLTCIAPAGAGGEWQVYPPFNHTMVPTLAAWQQQIIGIVKRLTDSYGADGIFLDSYGWRMNYPMYSRPDKHQCWPADYARGVLKLVDLVARTIGSGRVVLVETPSGPVGHHCHGGVSADFGWPPDDRAGLPGTTGPSDKIIASPVRYGLPEIRFFSNGGRGEGSLNRLHQIYAAGHGLALCHQHLVEDNGSHAAHIKELVELRRQHADALIHGQQIYQPKSLGDSDDVAAYCYRARTGKAVLTAVNTGDRPYSGALRLGPEQAGSTWYSVLSGHSIIAQGQDLPITLAAPSADTTADLAVLLPPDWLVPTMHLIAST